MSIDATNSNYSVYKTESGELDCIVIGYNEQPFKQYEKMIRSYGQYSEAYQDLCYSFVNIGENKYTYVDLINYVISQATEQGCSLPLLPDMASGDIPNLACVYLSQFLQRNGLNSKYINLFQKEKHVLSKLLNGNPLAIAITTTFYLTNQPVIEIVEFVRKINPEVKIIVGGPLILNHYRNYGVEGFPTAVADIGADSYIIESQGELTLLKLLQCYINFDDISPVPNVACYNNDFRLMNINDFKIENNDMNKNIIDWSLTNTTIENNTIQTRTARSCAFSCSFCNYPVRAGKLVTTDVMAVAKELYSIQSLGYIKNLIFVDDTFNVPIRRFKALCRMIIENGYDFNWYSYFRCSHADEESIELAARSGCKGVFLGIESGSEKILEGMNKKTDIERYINGIKLLKQHGILTFASFILGFPGETEATIRETQEFINLSSPDYYRIQLWYNEDGTPIRKRKKEYAITGEGFSWKTNTMNSLEAMDHIERLFLSIKSSTWLPQWSFDFWIIPYLVGKGIPLKLFDQLMKHAHEMLKLEFANTDSIEKEALQMSYLKKMIGAVKLYYSYDKINVECSNKFELQNLI